MITNRKTRRQFLKGAGGYLLALPFLPSLLPREAWGQSAVFAKRFLAIHNGHCQAFEQWYPDPSKVTWVQKGDYARQAALSSISGNVSQIIGSAFDPVRTKINILSRLDPTSSSPNHNAEVLLSGGIKGEFTSTLDHVLAKKLNNSSPLNLYIKSVSDQYYNGASHVSVANGNYSPGAFNPASVFSSLFGTANSGGSAADTSGTTRDLATVDRVFKEFQALKQSSRISKLDAQRLDEHMQLIFQIEDKLKKSSTETNTQVACKAPTGPASSPVLSSNPADFQVVIDQMFDVIEVGMRCGKVNVATLMLHVYDYFSGSVGFISGVSADKRFHEDIHHADTAELRAQKLLLNRFFGERVARFLKNLNTVEDPTTNKTYLDNSLIIWGNDQGALKHTGGHHSKNQPLLMAGSAGGFLKTGLYVDYGPAYASATAPVVGGEEYTYLRGRPYNQLLVTIAQAMGLAPADYETNGQQGFGVYATNTSQYDYLAQKLGDNHRRDILPLLKA